MKSLGHRGLILPSGKPYQNSLASFKEAVEKGDGIETDACVSADGEIFFIHEAKYLGDHVEYCLEEHLDNDSKGIVAGRKLEEMGSTEIKTLKLLDGSPIPHFDEVIELFKGNDKIFDIELKSSNSPETVVSKIKEVLDSGKVKSEQIIISSFNHPALVYARDELPNICLGMTLLPGNFKPAVLFPWTENTESRYEALTEDYLKLPIWDVIKPKYLIIPDTAATEETCKMIRRVRPELKLVVWVFTEMNSYDPKAFKEMTDRETSDGFLHAVLIDKF